MNTCSREIANVIREELFGQGRVSKPALHLLDSILQCGGRSITVAVCERGEVYITTITVYTVEANHFLEKDTF